MVTNDPGILAELVRSLEGLGYRNERLVQNYAYTDWFASKACERRVAAVGFSDTPPSYNTACIGLVESNGKSGQVLIDDCRALGAPVVLEIGDQSIREWIIAKEASPHYLVGEYRSDAIRSVFNKRASSWTPDELSRAKNIGKFDWAPEYDLFSGLLPELEEHIHDQLDPLLRSALSSTKNAYMEDTGREPDPAKIFRLIFWLLTAKVFHDRDVQGFKRFTNNPSADDLLRAVSNQYREKSTGLLTKRAREVASSHIWTKLNFKNVSVDVLSQIWSNTLVDDAVRDKLGIHRTSKSIVDYIINRIAFTQQTSPGLFVLEPCCGSGAFLIGAMNALRRQLFGLTAKDRHRYFTQTLRGIEKDAFGAEISRLALTLADFPNPDGWNIRTHDVFDDPQFPEDLSNAAVVLCNPPFEDFSEEDKGSRGDRHPKKPVALLNLVLDHLHPDGVIGFVVPPTFMSGKGGYAKIRRRLGERFSKLDVTYLPDRAFEGVSTESCLLVATKPIPFGSTTVTVSRVADSHYAWHKFEHAHEVTYRYEKTITPDNLELGLQMPDLSELWDFLEGNDRLDKVSTAHRGIEWSKKLTSDGSETGNRNELIRTTPKLGFALGVAPKTKFGPFDIPRMSYLDMRPENQRGNAYKHAWHIPKVIISKSSRSRGGWRLTAFADMDGVVCYQTYIGLWPKGKLYDPFVLSAILNSPVANAFIATWESKTGGRLTTLDRIPIPYIDLNAARKIRSLVQKYMTIRKQDKICNDSELKTALLMIDAEVLKSYQLPPRIENELLSYYWGEARPTDFAFTGYFNPEEDEAYYSLHERMQDDFEDSTIERQLLWLSRE